MMTFNYVLNKIKNSDDIKDIKKAYEYANSKLSGVMRKNGDIEISHCLDVANNTDIFNENGIRYEGVDPNNYICLDNKTSGACSSSSLLFRIIGLFEEEYSTNGTTSADPKKLLKVIDTNNYGGTSGKYWNKT